MRGREVRRNLQSGRYVFHRYGGRATFASVHTDNSSLRSTRSPDQSRKREVNDRLPNVGEAMAVGIGVSERIVRT